MGPRVEASKSNKLNRKENEGKTNLATESSGNPRIRRNPFSEFIIWWRLDDGQLTEEMPKLIELVDTYGFHKTRKKTRKMIADQQDYIGRLIQQGKFRAVRVQIIYTWVWAGIYLVSIPALKKIIRAG